MNIPVFANKESETAYQSGYVVGLAKGITGSRAKELEMQLDEIRKILKIDTVEGLRIALGEKLKEKNAT